MSDDGSTASAPGTPKEQEAETKLYEASGRPLRTGPRSTPNQTDQLAKFVQEQPLTAAFAALIIGYFIGK
jgi:hypothetical protein